MYKTCNVYIFWTDVHVVSLVNTVSVMESNSSHLIAYHPQRDLQPIILANCSYSLEVGKGTKVEYDFSEIETQIADRFLRGRPRIGFPVSQHYFKR